MQFGEEYKVNEDYDFSIKPGEYIVLIKKVELKESKSGKPMAVLTLSINGNFKIMYFLVDDRSDIEAYNRTNATLTRFFDCFKIARGNFKTETWLNKKGKVLLDYGKPTSDGNKYLEVKKLIVQTPNAPEVPLSSNSFKPPEDIHAEYDDSNDSNDSNGYIEDIKDEYIEEEEDIPF